MQDDVESCCIIFDYPDNDQDIKQTQMDFFLFLRRTFMEYLRYR